WDVLAGQSARLRRLADDLSLVSRTEEGLLELHRLPMAPARLVAASIDAAAPGYTAKGVQLGSDVAGGLPDVDVDPDGPHRPGPRQPAVERPAAHSPSSEPATEPASRRRRAAFSAVVRAARQLPAPTPCTRGRRPGGCTGWAPRRRTAPSRHTARDRQSLPGAPPRGLTPSIRHS